MKDNRIESLVDETIYAFTFPEELNEKHKDHQTVVYMAYNEETSDYYIGATSRKDSRFQEHLKSLKRNTHCHTGTTLFQKSYNEDPNFKFTSVPVCDIDTALEIEKRLINICKNDTHCLNVTGAHDYSEERREQMSQIAKANWQNPEYREKMESYLRSDEHRQLMTSIHSGKEISEEIKMKVSQRFKGIPQSPELIEKRAAALRGRSVPEELVRKSVEAKKRNFESLSQEEQEAHRNKLLEASKLGTSKVSKAVMVNGVEYESVSAAMRDLKMHPNRFYAKLKDENNSDFTYLTKD